MRAGEFVPGPAVSQVQGLHEPLGLEQVQSAVHGDPPDPGQVLTGAGVDGVHILGTPQFLQGPEHGPALRGEAVNLPVPHGERMMKSSFSFNFPLPRAVGQPGPAQTPWS